MSQSQLARATNLPLSSLKNWEQDRRGLSLEAATKIADALGVSLDELAGRTGAAPAKGRTRIRKAKEQNP
jgi:transcriptional regulator with XRE-family HTH domain